MTVNIEDVKLKTFANQPFKFSNLSIKPKTINEIIEIGYDTYNTYLNLLSATIDQLFPLSVKEQLPDDITVYDALAITGNKTFLNECLRSLSYFLLEEVKYSYGELIIGSDRYDLDQINDIKQVLQVQNCSYSNEEKEDFNPANERVRQIKEKMLQNRKRIQELKKSSGNDDELTFLDLLSILSSHANGINVFNVFELNMFQFNNQFNRMKLIEDYEVNIQALLNGADSKKIELKHWITKM